MVTLVDVIVEKRKKNVIKNKAENKATDDHNDDRKYASFALLSNA
jgi:hypothetical protein